MKIKAFFFSTFLMASLAFAGGYQHQNFCLGKSYFYDYVSKRFFMADVYFSIDQSKDGKTFGSLYLQYGRHLGIPDMPYETSQIVVFSGSPVEIKTDGTFEMNLPDGAKFAQVSDPVISVRKIRGTLRNPYSMFRFYRGIDLYDEKDQPLQLFGIN